MVDDDPSFRERVRDSVTPEQVGEAGWLWLDRPPGWKEQFARLLEAAEAEAADEAASRDVQQLRRAVERAEVAASRAASRAARAEEAIEQLREDLARERSARRAAEQRAATAEVALASAEAARAELARAQQEAGTAHASTRAELERLRAELVEARCTPAQPAVSAALDPVALAEILPRASSAADDLRDALSSLAGALREARSGQVATTPADEPVPGSGAVARTSPGGRRRRKPAQRRPAPLPPGRFDDDPAVVDHLARLPGVLLVVDGYNVTKTAWPGLSLPEQRARLVDTLDALHARTGAESVVVFDGAEPDATTATRQGSGAVRLRFTPDGVEADDMVVELAGAAPPSRPVVVVSSDKQVRDRARRAGANVLGAAQLLAAPVLRRQVS